jgi:hypothetical protein
VQCLVMRIELERSVADLCRRRHHRRRESSGMADAGGRTGVGRGAVCAGDATMGSEGLAETEV